MSADDYIVAKRLLNPLSSNHNDTNRLGSFHALLTSSANSTSINMSIRNQYYTDSTGWTIENNNTSTVKVRYNTRSNYYGHNGVALYNIVLQQYSTYYESIYVSGIYNYGSNGWNASSIKLQLGSQLVFSDYLEFSRSTSLNKDKSISVIVLVSLLIF